MPTKQESLARRDAGRRQIFEGAGRFFRSLQDVEKAKQDQKRAEQELQMGEMRLQQMQRLLDSASAEDAARRQGFGMLGEGGAQGPQASAFAGPPTAGGRGPAPAGAAPEPGAFERILGEIADPRTRQQLIDLRDQREKARALEDQRGQLASSLEADLQDGSFALGGADDELLGQQAAGLLQKAQNKGLDERGLEKLQQEAMALKQGVLERRQRQNVRQLGTQRIGETAKGVTDPKAQMELSNLAAAWESGALGGDYEKLDRQLRYIQAGLDDEEKQALDALSEERRLRKDALGAFQNSLAGASGDPPTEENLAPFLQALRGPQAGAGAGTNLLGLQGAPTDGRMGELEGAFGGPAVRGAMGRNRADAAAMGKGGKPGPEIPGMAHLRAALKSGMSGKDLLDQLRAQGVDPLSIPKPIWQALAAERGTN